SSITSGSAPTKSTQRTNARQTKKADATRRKPPMNDVYKSRLNERYTPGDRANHWIVATALIRSAVSGLALFHPALYWLTTLFGGGTWPRILHPWVGVFMFLLFLALAIRRGRYNRMNKSDRQWLRQFDDVMNKREDKVPEVGRYNAGQKLLYFALIIFMLGLL